MPANGRSHIRIARPSRDLEAAERFWTAGLGLEVLYRKEPEPGAEETEEGYALLMVGWRDADWHLELALHPHRPVLPSPGAEDLLVIYLDGPVPGELVTRLEEAGGTRVRAHNPYWDTWGVTVRDPDGYNLVLCTRGWSNTDV